MNCGEHEVMDFAKAEEVSDVKIDPSLQYHKDELIEYGFKITHISWKHSNFEIKML